MLTVFSYMMHHLDSSKFGAKKWLLIVKLSPKMNDKIFITEKITQSINT